MIEELLISNVRLFEGPEEWRIPLSGLTVFCGTNSAGKSTILKTLLLLCQTSSDSDAPSRVGRLRLSGGLVDFGNYQSIASHNRIDQDIVIGVTMRENMEIRHLRTLLKIRGGDAALTEIPSPITELEYSLTARFTCGLRHTNSAESNREQKPSMSGLKTGQQHVFLKKASFEFHAEGDLELSWTIMSDDESDTYYILLPRDYFGASSRGFQFMEIDRELETKQVRVEVLLRGLLPMGFWAQSKTKQQKGPESGADWAFFPLPPLLRECSRDVEIELDNVHYLGPLRSPARRYYMTHLDIDPKMDPAGEFLPYVLRDQRDQDVFYVPPKGTRVLHKPLKYVLDSWMFYLRTGEYTEADAEHDLHEIDVASMKDVLLEFKLKTFGGEAHALADSGFGYSQILPIVVRGLIARFGSTIVIEQPELHLNPAIQVRLAEFLASLVLAGKRLLIETHSEHIVNSLRVLSAEDPNGRLAPNCKIIYVDTESGKPQLKQLEIQPNGTIPEWPRQFFGEALSLSARLLRAQNKKNEDPVPE
jgi:predicted ATPase